MIKILDEEAHGSPKVGVDITTGEPMDPLAAGIYDNFLVKRQMLDSAAIISSQVCNHICTSVTASDTAPVTTSVTTPII
jgi:chaperonin GroEL (HSP60 family)